MHHTVFVVVFFAPHLHVCTWTEVAMIHIKGSEHSNWIKWQLFKFELLILQIRFQLNFNPLVVVVVVDVGVYSVVKSATNPPAIKIVFA